MRSGRSWHQSARGASPDDKIPCSPDENFAGVGQLRVALAARDGHAIETLMRRARDARERWLAGEFDRFRDESA